MIECQRLYNDTYSQKRKEEDNSRPRDEDSALSSSGQISGTQQAQVQYIINGIEKA